MLCSNSCKRRFAARMKADGNEPEPMMKRAYHDVFGGSKKYRNAGKRKTPELPLLPDREAWLLYATRTMKFHGIEPYRMGGGAFASCW